jgi:hypothetical protein
MSVEIKGLNSPREIPDKKATTYKAGNPVEKGEFDVVEGICCIFLLNR